MAESESKAAVARAFERKFPGVTLVAFNALRRELDAAYTRSHHVISFESPVAVLLRYGLIDQSMVPPGRKRYAHSGPFWQRDARGAWFSERVRGGRLRVDRELTDDFDPAHPLSEFGVKLWPALAPQHARLAQAATRIAASAFETSYTQLSELARDCAAVTSGEIAQLFVSAMRCQLEKLR